jgi:hypothetical protein
VRRAAWILAAGAAAWAAACSECIGPSHNRSVPPPAADEFQLIMNNGISRDLPVYVDEEEIGSICGESDCVIVGNFKVGTCTKVRAFNEVQQCMSDFGPCMAYMCEPPSCGTCFDTTHPEIAGARLDLRMCWEDRCDKEEFESTGNACQ